MTTRTTTQEPRFAYHQRVRLAAIWGIGRRYPVRARHGAIGVIVNVGPFTRGARRYSILFPDSAGLVPTEVRVLEDHLVAWESGVTP